MFSTDIYHLLTAAEEWQNKEYILCDGDKSQRNELTVKLS